MFKGIVSKLVNNWKRDIVTYKGDYQQFQLSLCETKWTETKFCKKLLNKALGKSLAEIFFIPFCLVIESFTN